MNAKAKAIEIALENELKERDFYISQSKKTDNPVGKKMFETIAQEEDEHYQKLKEIHKKLEQTGKWPKEVSTVINETNIRESLKELPSIVDQTFNSTADDKEAIKIAIAFEKEAHVFYANLKKEAEDAQEKSFFGHLADIEWEHMQSLEDTLAFFEDPAAWYANSEKSQLDG